MTNNLQIISLNNPLVTAYHIGSVIDVIQGNISKKILEERRDASEMLFGFELASPKTSASLGEAVITKDNCFATSTDKTSKEYGSLIYGKTYTPGGVFYLKKDSKPTHRAILQRKTIPLLAFYEKVVQSIPAPLLFEGLFYFKTLHAIAISKPPIYGEEIFSHKEEYYRFPKITLSNRCCLVVGAMYSRKTAIDPQLKKGLDTVLYDNPFDHTSDVVQHAHILILKENISDIDQLLPSHVESCLHLFMEESYVEEIKADLFALTAVKSG